MLGRHLINLEDTASLMLGRHLRNLEDIASLMLGRHLINLEEAQARRGSIESSLVVSWLGTGVATMQPK
jgi:hypothetical protein